MQLRSSGANRRRPARSLFPVSGSRPLWVGQVLASRLYFDSSLKRASRTSGKNRSATMDKIVQGG